MLIQQMKDENLEAAYGVQCQFLMDKNKRNGLYPTFVRIAPKEKTSAHAHYEEELFYILTGQGQLKINQEIYDVKAGDLITIPPFSEHELANKTEQELDFLSVYSEDYTIKRLPEKNFITVAPPTPNGPLHLGHISGPYLAADILKRYLLLQGVQARILSGTDDFQNYVFEKAKNLGQDPMTFQSEMRKRVIQGLTALQIEFDEFKSPAIENGYAGKVLEFFERAKSLGVIEKTLQDYPFCPECNEFLTDALAQGICVHCGSASHGACENCGMVSMPTELMHLQCAHGHEVLNSKPVELYTFNLSDYFSLIEQDIRHQPLSSNQNKLFNKIKEQKNLKVLVSHPTTGDFGVKIPGTEQVLHVWFEMAANYEKYALQKESWVSCFGFDNSFYYLFFIPALLKAMNPNARIMDAIVANEFLLLEGSKFSTSRQHAIWADEGDYDSDFLRLYLSFIRPSTQQTNFSESEFKTFSQNLESQFVELEKILQAINENIEGIAKSEIDSRALIYSNRFTRDFEMFMSPQEFNPRLAARSLLFFLDQILFFEGSLVGQRMMIKAFLTSLQIFMPRTADKYFSQARFKTKSWKKDWSSDNELI